MSNNVESGSKPLSSDLSLFGAGLVPFALSNIDNPKLTKIVSRGLMVGIAGKFVWDWVKSKQNNDKYTSINIHEGSTWFDYVIRWLSQTKVEYQGSEFEFVDLGNINNNKQHAEEICAVAQLHGEKVEQNHSFDFMPSSNCKVMIDGIEVIVSLEKINRDNNNVRWAKDKFVIKIKSKKEEDLRRVFAQIEELGHTKSEYPLCNVYTFTWGWRKTKKIYKKKDVVLPNNQFEIIKDNVLKFLDSRDFYHDRGMNWRLGIMLESSQGGTGKTTTVQAIATHCGLDVYMVNLSEMDDAKLSEAVNNIPEKCILLLDDVRPENLSNNSEVGKLSLAGILQALDGIGSAEGRVCFLCTNLKQELPELLYRPGRIDLEFNFTYATKEQILDLAAKFRYDLDKKTAEKWEKEKIVMAMVQNRLIGLTK